MLGLPVRTQMSTAGQETQGSLPVLLVTPSLQLLSLINSLVLGEFSWFWVEVGTDLCRVAEGLATAVPSPGPIARQAQVCP